MSCGTCHLLHVNYTAFHFQYLTSQDTHITPNLTKHYKTLARLVKLLSLQPRPITQMSRAFFVPSIELIFRNGNYFTRRLFGKKVDDKSK